MKMKIKIMVSVCLVCLTACQLPDRKGIDLNVIPVFDTDSIIDSKIGLLSDGISKVPGTICIADAKTGKCDAKKLVPSQCLVKGSTVEVKPITNPQPAYHSLINNLYKAEVPVPFVNAASKSEFLDEIKASISGVASIKSIGDDGNNGYPGIDGIKACLLRAYGPKKYGKVFWIQAANIIAVARSNFRKVSNSLSVTGTGFGFGGSTYNNDIIDQQSIWIGLYANEIEEVGEVSVPSVAASSAKVVSSDNKTTVIETSLPPSAPPSPVTESIIK